MPNVNVDAMNEHLAEISRCVSVGAIALMVLHRAGWHTSANLAVPNHILLMPLPPDAPELNPVESLWEFLRGNLLANRVCDDYDAIVTACANARNALMRLPKTITSIASRTWAQVTI